MPPWLQPTLDAAGRLPFVAYVPALAGLVGGLLLLLAGNKVLKPVTVVLGAALGGLLGVIALTSLLEGHTYECPAALASMGLGAVIGAVAALGLFRAALALSGAASFAALGVLIGGAVLAQSTPTTAAKVEFGVRDKLTLVAHAVDPDPSFESANHVHTTARVAASHALDHVSNVWEAVPDRARGTLILIALGAGVLGLVVGALAPRKTEAIVTALAGGALFLTSLVWLVSALDVPGAGVLNRGAVGWLAIWGGVALVGLGVQTVTGPSKPKSA
jgi:hypothetical protein